MKKSNITECEKALVSKTQLSQLVGLAEKHAPQIDELRLRIDCILARLEGPQPEGKQAEQDEHCGLLHRLDCANSKALEAIEDLEMAVTRLEKLV